LVLPVAINAIDEGKRRRRRRGRLIPAEADSVLLMKESGIPDLHLRPTFRELVAPEKYERQTFE
jgi:hypothetical protein